MARKPKPKEVASLLKKIRAKQAQLRALRRHANRLRKKSLTHKIKRLGAIADAVFLLWGDKTCDN